MELLSLAYTLSLLTYSLGAVLYGSPIPIRSIKKWGVLMMYDGLASVILVSLYSLIMRLGDYLLGVLGASWPYFMAWLTGRTAILVTSYISIQSIATILKTVGADVLLELLKHVGNLIATTLTAIKMMYLISMIVYGVRDKILAIGVLLYTLPIRVGKSVGATMIALSIVYYVGLPLMPAFAAFFETTPIPIYSDRYVSISGAVVDAVGGTVPYAVVELHGDSADPVAVVVGDVYGRFYVGPPTDTISVGREFSVKVDFMGYRIQPDPGRVAAPWNGTLRLCNLIYPGNGLALLIAGIIEVASFNSTGSSFSMNISVISSEATLGLVKLAEVGVAEIEVDEGIPGCSWSSFSWAGLSFEECFIYLDQGEHYITVSYSGKPYLKPDVGEKHYLEISDVVEYLNILQTAAVSYVYSYLLLPSAYLIVLSTSTYALSKFLGGSLRLRLV